jgi:hypothetical protein
MVQAFPFLLTSIQAKTACCGQSGRQPDYNSIKTAIAGMPTEGKEQFKKMLGAVRCRVIYRSGNASGDIIF